MEKENETIEEMKEKLYDLLVEANLAWYADDEHREKLEKIVDEFTKDIRGNNEKNTNKK